MSEPGGDTTPELDLRRLVAVLLASLAAFLLGVSSSLVINGEQLPYLIVQAAISLAGLLLAGFVAYVRQPDSEDGRVALFGTILIALVGGLGIAAGASIDAEPGAVRTAAALAGLAIGSGLLLAAGLLWVRRRGDQLSVLAASALIAASICGSSAFALASGSFTGRLVVALAIAAGAFALIFVGLAWSARQRRPRS